jgi:hypothetical protein
MQTLNGWFELGLDWPVRDRKFIYLIITAFYEVRRLNKSRVTNT